MQKEIRGIRRTPNVIALSSPAHQRLCFPSIRRDYVIPCNLERREMVGNVVLYFSVLSSAVSLKTPLPAYLPPASGARNRLVKRLYELPIVRRRIVRGGSEGLLYL